MSAVVDEAVVLFDHTLRDSTVAPGHGELREAVRRVHDDQTLDSAPKPSDVTHCASD